MQPTHVKQRLLAAKGDIEARLAQTQKHFHKEVAVSANSHERAVETSNDEVVGALDAEGQRELQQINRALQRLEGGEYAYCSRCGKGIGEQRLTLLPFTEHCIACARDTAVSAAP